MSAESSAEERAWAGEKREFVADSRDDAADERDIAADARDVIAGARDVIADAREAQLNEGEEQLQASVSAFGLADSGAAAERGEGRAARELAREERSDIGRDREEEKVIRDFCPLRAMLSWQRRASSSTVGARRRTRSRRASSHHHYRSPEGASGGQWAADPVTEGKCNLSKILVSRPGRVWPMPAQAASPPELTEWPVVASHIPSRRSLGATNPWRTPGHMRFTPPGRKFR
jgi:hypothetical protein